MQGGSVSHVYRTLGCALTHWPAVTQDVDLEAGRGVPVVFGLTIQDMMRVVPQLFVCPPRVGVCWYYQGQCHGDMIFAVCSAPWVCSHVSALAEGNHC